MAPIAAFLSASTIFGLRTMLRIIYFGGPIQARSGSKPSGDLEFDSRDFEDSEEAGAGVKKIKAPPTPGRKRMKTSKSEKSKPRKSSPDAVDAELN